MKRLGWSCMVMALVLTWGCIGSAQYTRHLQHASRLQRSSDPVQGDWMGTYKDEDGKHPLFAQMIALGDGAYRINLLAAFDEPEPPLVVLNANMMDAAIDLEGEATSGPLRGTHWTGIIERVFMEGTFEGEKSGTFKLKQVKRSSPTVGATPSGVVRLFDGENADEWVHPVRNPWTLDLLKTVGGDKRVAYLRTWIHAAQSGAATLELGSDDGVKVWMNGEVVHANNTSRGVSPGEDKVPVSLNGGWNELMLKVTQGTGDWAACVRLGDSQGGIPAGIRSAMQQGAVKKAAPLEATKGYLMAWELSAPYSFEDRGPRGLFDCVFPPEAAFAPAGDDAPQVHGELVPWVPLPREAEGPQPCRWQLLDNSAMEVRGGGIVSKRKFRDHKIHVEFRLPFMPKAREQARGNSGVYVQGRYEIQILDSYGMPPKDNECGGIYKVSGPRVNMCAPPLQWQTYDITFRAARFDGTGKKTENARISVMHNGVPIHEDLVLPGPTAGCLDTNESEPGGLYLQDHGNPVWFRNIWVLEMDKDRG